METHDMIELLKTIVPLITPLIIIYIFIKYGSRIQFSESIKSKSLGDVYFLYEANPKVYSNNGRKVIEIEVKISNQSLSKLAILAIFVKFKPIINTSNIVMHSNIKFDSLPDFEQKEEFELNTSISKFKNIAFAKGFFWQTSVNGVSVRRGFDIATEEFCKKYPIIMTQIVIYGSSTNYIDKTHFPKYHIDSLRIPFCNFLEEKNQENYDFFRRMGKDGYVSTGGRLIENLKYSLLKNLIPIKLFKYFRIKEGERILVKKDGKLDIKNTKLFFPILKSVINSNIEKVIDLSTSDDKLAKEQNTV